MTEVVGCQLVTSTPIVSAIFLSLKDMQKKRCKLYFFKFQRRILHHTGVSHRHFCAYEGQRQLVGGVIREQGLNLSSVSFAVWPCGSCLIY